MPKVTVQYGAMSNISYQGTITVDIDYDAWVDGDDSDRATLVDEAFMEWLQNDIDYGYNLNDADTSDLDEAEERDI